MDLRYQNQPECAANKPAKEADKKFFYAGKLIWSKKYTAVMKKEPHRLLIQETKPLSNFSRNTYGHFTGLFHLFHHHIGAGIGY
ncbi:hypothetical protein TUM17387_20250 [Shewanella carassii]|nr:hypothetical protein TUM17387_20250 [Shewanella carassii]